MSPELVVAPFATFISVSLLVFSLLWPRENTVRDKLQPYSYRSSQDPDNLSRPFSARVVFPLLEGLGRLAGSVAPQHVQERMKEAVDEAGNPITVNAYLSLRGIGMVLVPALYLLLVFSRTEVGAVQMAVFIFLAIFGSYMPKRWLAGRAQSRRKAIERALPDALDLIVVSMEAGLALDGAIAKVVEKTHGPLTEELKKMLQEIQLGKARRDALRHMASRTRVKDLITLVNAVVQADQMGVGMAQVMRTQADEARIKRRQRAEEKAHQAAVKMLFPLVFFILPAVLMVTVGPAALSIYSALSSGIFG